MELEHLRTFLAVVEHRGFRSAARRLYLSEPAVSRQVSALERDVGVPLLLRTRAGVEPTPAGTVLAEQAQVLVDDHAAVVRRARLEALGGHLVLGVTPGGAGELTDPLLRHVRRSLPGLELHRYDFSLLQWPAVPPPGVDLLLVRDPIADERLRVTTLLTETMALAPPPGSEVLDAPFLTLEEVLGLPFVRLSSRVAPRFTRFWTLDEHRGAGDLCFQGQPAAGPVTLARAVARGAGAALATPMVARMFGSPPPPLISFADAPCVRLALVSAREDRRPLVEAVHREVEWATRRLGPLVLPELAEAV
jgi:DNA-binding transcriptional LysR family regulator